MKNLIPFITSFFLPGLGHFFLKDYSKGVLIIFIYLLSTYFALNLDFLSLIPFWFPHIIIMIWSIFGVYDKTEQLEGKKSATKYLAFSSLIIFVLLPLTLTIITNGFYKGAEFFTNEYFNEGRTKAEMNEISTELNLYKDHYGIYPTNYQSFIGRKPIWGSWTADNWKNPYKYELLDSVNYKLISAGKDGIYYNGDDITRSN